MENYRREKAPFILGITGGVGAGKSTVLSCLEKEYGFYVIQADLVARRLMEPGQPCYEAVCQYLGPVILNQDGTINRPVMADIIFHDKEKRTQVDALTHPLVWKTIKEEALAHKERPVVIEAAVISKEFRDNCTCMWYLYTSRQTRAARLKESRGYSEEKIKSIMENQADEETFKSLADVVIDNNGTAEETRRQIRKCLEEWEGQ